MSDQPHPGQPGQEPTEEEIRAYLGQLRAAPVDQVVAEVASALLNAAQVKLGRRDGRLLIDATRALTDVVRGRLPEDLTGQLDQALTQLQLAQVDAEREVAAAAAQGQHEPDDLPAAGGDATPGAPEASSPSGPTSAATSQAPPAGGPGDAASRLWVPGR